MKIKIAIQGIENSFHHEAVKNLLGEDYIELHKCDTFEKVTDSITSFKTDYGLIAIENTIAGSILSNYNLIDDNELVIIDEIYLNIQMFLMALEGESIHDIKEVHSHPVALLQCKDYLRKFPPQFKVVEGKDTASEAKKIKEKGLFGVAAIAGEQVAKKYGLQILDSNIQSMKNNKTRFVLIGRKLNTSHELINKATLRFELSHDVGSLSNVLQLFSTFKINLNKIQSLPVVGSPWQYAFFVDVLFQDYMLFTEVIKMLDKATKNLKILGVYRDNKENEESVIVSDLENKSSILNQ